MIDQGLNDLAKIIEALTNLILKHFENHIEKIEAMLDLIENAPEEKQNHLFFLLMLGYRPKNSNGANYKIFQNAPHLQTVCLQLRKEFEFLFFLKQFPPLSLELRSKIIWAFIHTKRYTEEKTHRLAMLATLLESKNNNGQ